MNALTLSFASLRARKLQSSLCILAIACGITLLLSVSLLFTASEKGLRANAGNIDMVVGAKGSPLQLVLSTVYHADIPTGNITMHDMEAIERNPQVRSVIPLAIGDNYKGYRVVGTTTAYPVLYKAQLSSGVMMKSTFDVVAGANVPLDIGTEFAATHGFSADGGDVHNDHMYKVVGKLKPTGTSIDKLIITPFESVQESHAHHHHEEKHSEHEHSQADEDDAEITALLVEVKSPAALMNLPRQINESEHTMASVPSHVIARTMKSANMGKDSVIILGGIFLSLAVLMLLSVLASGLAQRKYDIAVLRVLGASSGVVTRTVMYEGLILGFMGSFFGVVMGHILAYSVACMLPLTHSLFLPVALLQPALSDAYFLAGGIACGVIASILPCVMAARADTASTLAQGRA